MQTETDQEEGTPETDPAQGESPELESEAITEANADAETTAEAEAEADAEADAEAKPRRPSVIINVYSWATPIVGVLMLVIGLLAGYFGRPLMAPKAEATVPAAAVQSTNPTEEAQRQEMMTFLVGQVKHFKGDPNAPVTIIEFSDYQ